MSPCNAPSVQPLPSQSVEQDHSIDGVCSFPCSPCLALQCGQDCQFLLAVSLAWDDLEKAACTASHPVSMSCTVAGSLFGMLSSTILGMFVFLDPELVVGVGLSPQWCTATGHAHDPPHIVPRASEKGG